MTIEATLEELGLSSLERIEMMVALEEALNTNIDEAAFSNASDANPNGLPAIICRKEPRRARPAIFRIVFGFVKRRADQSAVCGLHCGLLASIERG